MPQQLDFLAGSKRYYLRNGIKIEIIKLEHLEHESVYHGHEVDNPSHNFVWLSDGNSPLGEAYDLISAADWREK